MRFLIYFTKGLKDVVKDEISDHLEDFELISESDKYIVLDTGAERMERILDLKTVNDVHRLLDFHNFGHRPDEGEITEIFPAEKLHDAEQLIRSIRGFENSFSLTVSRYDSGNLDLERLENQLAELIGHETGYSYTEDDHSNFDIRVHVEQENAIISCRLTRKPLYYRSYWREGRKGSLRTSIAAALCKLADTSEANRMVDNFCGAGTILCEAKLQGLEPSGGDVEREAVRKSRQNLSELDQESANRIKKLDATSTNWPDDRFDLAVSNLPWGKHVELNAVELYSGSIEEYSRILEDEAEIVLLCKKPELATKHLEKNFPDHRIESFRLGFLGQKPWVIRAHTYSG